MTLFPSKKKKKKSVLLAACKLASWFTFVSKFDHHYGTTCILFHVSPSEDLPQGVRCRIVTVFTIQWQRTMYFFQNNAIDTILHLNAPSMVLLQKHFVLLWTLPENALIHRSLAIQIHRLPWTFASQLLVCALLNWFSPLIALPCFSSILTDGFPIYHLPSLHHTPHDTIVLVPISSTHCSLPPSPGQSALTYVGICMSLNCQLFNLNRVFIW